MSVQLPSVPAPQSAKPRLMRFGGDLTPSLGGVVQRIVRAGTRYQVDITLPPLTDAPARAWRAALLGADALGSTVSMAFPEFDGVPLGAEAVMDGAGQTGMALACRGLTSGVDVPAGSFFSILSGGRHYLHMTTADVAASSGGEAILPITPMLRIAPSDGAALTSAPAIVEGFVEGQTIEWDEQADRTTAITFTLTEAE